MRVDVRNYNLVRGIKRGLETPISRIEQYYWAIAEGFQIQYLDKDSCKWTSAVEKNNKLLTKKGEVLLQLPY